MTAWRRLIFLCVAVALAGCERTGVLQFPDEVSGARAADVPIPTTTTWHWPDRPDSPAGCTIWPTTTVWYGDRDYPTPVGVPTTGPPAWPATTMVPTTGQPYYPTTMVPMTTTIPDWLPPSEPPPDYVPEPPDIDPWHPPTTGPPEYYPTTTGYFTTTTTWYNDGDYPTTTWPYTTTTWGPDSDHPSCDFGPTTTGVPPLPPRPTTPAELPVIEVLRVAD